MRCLFTVQPMFGHFNAMVPLARALQDAGHDVAFATGKGFGPIVHRAGFRHFPCGLDFDGSLERLEAMPEWQPIKASIPPGPVQQLSQFRRLVDKGLERGCVLPIGRERAGPVSLGSSEIASSGQR